MNNVEKIKNKNILLLQGPMGGFFKRLSNYFEKNGASTYKIGFNGGDWLYSNKKVYIPYRDTKENWENYIKKFLTTNKIDKIFLFGDCRYYQNIAIKVAQQLHVDTFVFEEGYVRPDYVTLEKWGVNNFSMISRDFKFYNNLSDVEITKAIPTHNSSFKLHFESAFYYIFAFLLKFYYPHYKHHRGFNPFQEAFYGVRNLFRRYKYKFTEKGSILKIIKKDYFFVPLQTYNDFQITTHSNFTSIQEFINVTLTSFSKFAPENRYLVIKHHPVDRGRCDYKKYIYKLAKQLGIEKQIIVIYDLHLPTLLKHTLGTVTINSTVGLQALYHHSPVKVLGNAIYDIKNLTYQKNLDSFWKDPTTPNIQLLSKFRNYLIKNTQINGSFYGYFNFSEL